MIPFLGFCTWVLPVAWCLDQQQEHGPELELDMELELELEQVWGQWSVWGGGSTEEAQQGALQGGQELGQCKVEGQIVAEEVEWAGGSLTGIQWWGSKEVVGRFHSQLEAAQSLQVRLNQVNVT